MIKFFTIIYDIHSIKFLTKLTERAFDNLQI